MKSRLILIFALFLTLTSFRSDENAVKQNVVSILKSMNAAPVRPIFTRILTDRIGIPEGSRVLFEVSYEGNPTCRVTWYKDGVPLKNGDNGIKITSDGNSSTLYIGCVRLEDAGRYGVRIVNSLGMAESRGVLSVVTPSDSKKK